jgi:hypothetical protein
MYSRRVHIETEMASTKTLATAGAAAFAAIAVFKLLGKEEDIAPPGN